jgi:hypothetical protein
VAERGHHREGGGERGREGRREGRAEAGIVQVGGRRMCTKGSEGRREGCEGGVGRARKLAGWRVQVGKREPGEARVFSEWTAAIAHDGAYKENNYVEKIYIHGNKVPTRC